MNTPIPFGITLYAGKAIFRLRVKIDSSMLPDLQKFLHPYGVYASLTYKGYTLIEGICNNADIFTVQDAIRIARYQSQINALQARIDGITTPTPVDTL
jgi:hypothetical protein